MINKNMFNELENKTKVLGKMYSVAVALYVSLVSFGILYFGFKSFYKLNIMKIPEVSKETSIDSISYSPNDITTKMIDYDSNGKDELAFKIKDKMYFLNEVEKKPQLIPFSYVPERKFIVAGKDTLETRIIHPSLEFGKSIMDGKIGNLDLNVITPENVKISTGDYNKNGSIETYFNINGYQYLLRKDSKGSASLIPIIKVKINGKYDIGEGK